MAVFDAFSSDISEGWTILKDGVIELALGMWDGLVGAAGWITQLFQLGSKLFTDLWGAITGNAGSMTMLKADAIAIAGHLWDGLVGSTGWITKILSLGTQLFQDLYNKVAGPGSILATFLTDALAIFQSLWDGLVGPEGILATLVKKVYDYFLGGSLDSFMGIITTAWSMIELKIGSVWESIAASIESGIKNARRMMIEGLNSMIDAANSAIDALNEVASAIGMPKIGHIDRIPEYAIGTQGAKGGMALVGEAGPEIVNLPRGSEVGTSARTVDLFARQADTISERVNAAIDRAIQGFSAAVENMAKGSEARMVQAVQSSAGSVASQNTEVTNNITTNEQHDHWHMTVNSRAEAATVVQDYNTMKLLKGR